MVSISIKPLHSLEEILKYENAIWSKISQPRLEELLKGHEDYITGLSGGKTRQPQAPGYVLAGFVREGLNPGRCHRFRARTRDDERCRTAGNQSLSCRPAGGWFCRRPGIMCLMNCLRFV